MIAEVILNSTASDLNKTFDYDVPDNMNVVVGARVLIPFGKRKIYEVGYVVKLKEESNYECKSIIKVIDYVFDEKKIKLANWISKTYFCTMADVFRLFVPPGTTRSYDRVKTKTEKYVFLQKKDIDDKVKSEKQKKVLEFLKDNGAVPKSALREFVDVSDAVLKTLEKNGYIEIKDIEVNRNPFWNKEIKKANAVILTDEQRQAVESINISKYGEYLIHGVTGSGKTEVYLQLIDEVIKSGKNAIILVPEISLTPQITDRFLSRFGETIAILHSRLSLGERFDEWKKIDSNKSRIVIGARSAIFAPVKNIGIIIIDEEHDSSYKSDSTPKYDARDVAKYIAAENNIPIVLGSATPDVRTYYRAMNNEVKLLKLEKRISKSGLPNIEIVDMRDELATGNRTPFSRKLYFSMKEAITNKEQIMLFLNRRGYSTFIMCRDCGYVLKCEDCDVSMTYHMDQNRLICHYCGKTKSVSPVCPSCNSKNIKYFGTGTQKIEALIKKYFPEASVIRMDVDTTREKNGHEKILNKFRNEKIDILLGTQMIAKGHDFSNVTLVGILAADISMNIGDYRANERTYQLLLQMSGRAGRGDKKGTAIIQTYMPDEFSIQSVKEQNYTKFYNTEIKIREKLNYPPFCDIIIAVASGEDEDKVKGEITRLYDSLKISFNVYPPAPAPISKINNEYRWRILIKDVFDKQKTEKFYNILFDGYKVQSTDVRLSIDKNPNNML